MDVKLSFKPINIIPALDILKTDLLDKKMSPEIIQEIGELFIKHMYIKEYENNESSFSDHTNETKLDDEVSSINNSLNNSLNNNEEVNNNKEVNELNNNEEVNEEIDYISKNISETEMIKNMSEIDDFDEETEKRKLMKYLTLGWYIYTKCMTT